jgi:hypothetical protein
MISSNSECSMASGAHGRTEGFAESCSCLEDARCPLGMAVIAKEAYSAYHRTEAHSQWYTILCCVL